jgi:hypothetical protein
VTAALRRSQQARLRLACGTAGLILSDHSRALVRLAEDIGKYDYQLSKSVHASRAGANEDLKRATQRSLGSIVQSISSPGPSFVMVINRNAELLAGVRVPAGLEGESARDARTKAVVESSLSDLWVIDGKLYRIAAAPLMPVRVQSGTVATQLSSVSSDDNDCLRDPTTVKYQGSEYWLLVSRLGGARSYLALYLPL